MKKLISAIYSLFSKYARVNLQGRNVGHPPLYNAEVKNERSYVSTPPICLKAVDSENFTLPLPIPIPPLFFSSLYFTMAPSLFRLTSHFVLT